MAVCDRKSSIEVKYLDVPDTRKIKLRHRFLNWAFHKPAIAGFMLDVLHWVLKASRLPLGVHWNPLTKLENNVFVHLPANVEVQAQNVALPTEVAKELIRRAKHRLIMDHCVCREAAQCKTYNHDISCIILGDTGKEFVPQYTRYISAEEACKHVDRAVAAGLVPTTTRTRVDNYYFMVPDRHAIVGICFCCECCCFIPKYREVPTERLKQLFPKIPGMEIRTTEDCDGCGVCIDTCAANAITVMNGRALRSDTCTMCGRCAKNCPLDAVAFTVSDPNYVSKTVDRFLAVANLDDLDGKN